MGATLRTWRCVSVALLVALLATLGSAAATAQPAASVDYELGRGLPLGDSGVRLGGYATVEFSSRKGAREQLKSSHASAFVWWEGLERVKVFAEFDLENLLASRRDGDHDGDNDRRLSMERLYIDVALGDTLTGRVGKFLTPIGRWNLAHADPLVWTTTRPLSTQSVVPRNLTGAMALGRLPWGEQSLSYSLYASNGAEWDVDPRQDPFSRVRGARIVMPAGHGLEFGLSLARYAQRSARAQARTLSGLDVLWSYRGFEFSAEWLRSGGAAGALALDGEAAGATSENDDGARHGAYVQAVLPLQGRLFMVGRMEWLHDARSVGRARQHLLGLVWRLNPAASIKAEVFRPGGDGAELPRGFVASLSVLF